MFCLAFLAADSAFSKGVGSGLIPIWTASAVDRGVVGLGAWISRRHLERWKCRWGDIWRILSELARLVAEGRLRRAVECQCCRRQLLVNLTCALEALTNTHSDAPQQAVLVDLLLRGLLKTMNIAQLD